LKERKKYTHLQQPEFFFWVFWGSHTGNHPQEELAKFTNTIPTHIPCRQGFLEKIVKKVDW
jgi:hypothetical protein